MKAKVLSWDFKDTGVPALWTRTQYPDGSVGYDGVFEVTMKFEVVGNADAAHKFLGEVRVGQPIKSLNFGGIKPKGRRPETRARMYVFTD